MGHARRRYEIRREAKATLNRLFKRPDSLNVIHYSCESFYDRDEPTSPRITSIAVRNVGAEQTTSFSIHQVGERLKVDFAEIDKHYDSLEKQMFEEFYEYVRNHRGSNWLHWNMRDINCGFPA